MRTVQLTFLWAVVISGIAGPALGADPTAEEKWARALAEDYWKALRANKGEQAAALLSPELARALKPEEGLVWGEPKFDGPSRRVLPGKAVGPDVSVTFDAQELAPDESEVVFRGRLSGKDWSRERVAAEFTMRVAREKDGGKWGIRYLLVTDAKKKP